MSVPRPAALDRRLFVALPIALVAIQLVSGGVDLLLAAALDRAGPAAAVTTFGVIAGISSLCALLVYPLVGAASDRTASPLGRRSTWVAVGAVGTTGGLMALGRAETVEGLGVAYVVAIAFLPAMLVPLYASIPDRVARDRRGTIGALVGGATIVGGVVGNLVAARFADRTDIGATVFALALVTGCAIFLLLGRERPSPFATDVPNEENEHAGAHRRYRDLALVAAGRFSTFLAYAAVTGLAYYLFRDHVGTGNPAAGVAAFALVSGLATLGASLLTGPWSDLVGKRRAFVAVACLLIALGAAVPAVAPSFAAMLAAGALVGFGLGTYLAVGTALATLVLPSSSDRGRDIGLIGLSSAAAQGAAPLVGSFVAAELGYPAMLAAATACGLLGAIAVVPVRTAP